MIYLRQLVEAAPHELWATTRADRPYAESPMFSGTAVFWMSGTLGLGMRGTIGCAWKAKPRLFKGGGLRVSVIAALDGLYRGLSTLAGVRPVCAAVASTDSFSEMCVPCARALGTRVARSAHAARLHGYRSKAFLAGRGRTCPACGKHFARRTYSSTLD